jgi:hypothetical protein
VGDTPLRDWFWCLAIHHRHRLRARHLLPDGLPGADEDTMIDWLWEAFTEVIEIGCVYLLILAFALSCLLAVIVGLMVSGLVH